MLSSDCCRAGNARSLGRRKKGNETIRAPPLMLYYDDSYSALF